MNRKGVLDLVGEKINQVRAKMQELPDSEYDAELSLPFWSSFGNWYYHRKNLLMQQENTLASLYNELFNGNLNWGEDWIINFIGNRRKVTRDTMEDILNVMQKCVKSRTEEDACRVKLRELEEMYRDLQDIEEKI